MSKIEEMIMWEDGKTPVNAKNLNTMRNNISTNNDNISALRELKFDKATLVGNVLKFFANNVEKYSFSLPISEGGAGVPGTPGQDGREIELRKNSTHIEWRYVGEESWRQLVSLEELKGQDGNPGIDGQDGESPTLEIGNVSTLEPGSRATASVRLISENRYAIDLGIPRGAKGQDGTGGGSGSVVNPTLEIGSVTSGEVASAEIVGDSPNYTINLVLPKGEKGEQGLTGERGPQGKPGAKGEQGSQGEKGNDGITPNITIGEVTTLEAGQQATVTKRGTVEEPIFDFGIPKGQDGVGESGCSTTSITVNGQVYQDENGTINLPNYPEVPTKNSELTNDSGFITSDDPIDASTLNGKKFSEPMTKQEYDSLPEKDENTIYLVDDDTSIIGIPNYSIDDANKILTVNTKGDNLVWLTAPSGGGSDITFRDILDGEAFSTDEVIVQVKGEIVLSVSNLTINVGEVGTFTVKLDKAPTVNQTVTITCNEEIANHTPSTMTFTPDNYSKPQTVTIIPREDNAPLENRYITIGVQSDGVETKYVSVTVTNSQKEISSISAVYTQGNEIIYPSTPLISLRSSLVVTASFADGSSSVVNDYELSGNLTVGISNVTVTYKGKTTTFAVAVIEEPQYVGDFYVDNEGWGNLKAEYLGKFNLSKLSASDPNHVYFSIPSQALFTTSNMDDKTNVFGDSIPFGGICSSDAFLSGSYSCPDFCYVLISGSFRFRMPIEAYTNASENLVKAIASVCPIIKFNLTGVNLTKLEITDELVDRFTKITTSTTATTKGEAHTGFLDGAGFITVDGNWIDQCFCSIGGYSYRDYKKPEIVNWFISVSGGRVNYSIPYELLNECNLNTLKEYLKANRLIFYKYNTQQEVASV